MTWHGTLSGDALGEVVAGARALVVPSVSYEAASRVILEAYAAGVPTIVHRLGGMSELVVDGKTGYLVEPHDPDGWADAVGSLQDDRTSRELGDAAFKTWVQKYSPDVARANLVEAYVRARSVLSAPSGSA